MKFTKFERSRLEFAMLSLDNYGVLLKRRLLLADIRLSCHAARSVDDYAIGYATDLELVDLPLFVVLEVIHILLQLLDFRLCCLLLLLRSVNGSTEVGDRLFRLLDLLSDLYASRVRGRHILGT